MKCRGGWYHTGVRNTAEILQGSTKALPVVVGHTIIIIHTRLLTVYDGDSI